MGHSSIQQPFILQEIHGCDLVINYCANFWRHLCIYMRMTVGLQAVFIMNVCLTEAQLEMPDMICDPRGWTRPPHPPNQAELAENPSVVVF